MSAIPDKIQSDAKKLDRAEKFQLANVLWHDLQEMSPAAEAYWQQEITKRFERLNSGEAKLISLDEFRQRYAFLEKDSPK